MRARTMLVLGGTGKTDRRVVDARPSIGGLGQPSDEILLGNRGLAPTDERARARGATVSVTDGPFTETKEMIGSFAFPPALSF